MTDQRNILLTDVRMREVYRNIPNDVAKQWVKATIDDIINAIQNRIDRLEVK